MQAVLKTIKGKALKTVCWGNTRFSYQERGLRQRHYIYLYHCYVLQKRKGFLNLFIFKKITFLVFQDFLLPCCPH